MAADTQSHPAPSSSTTEAYKTRQILRDLELALADNGLFRGTRDALRVQLMACLADVTNCLSASTDTGVDRVVQSVVEHFKRIERRTPRLPPKPDDAVEWHEIATMMAKDPEALREFVALKVPILESWEGRYPVIADGLEDVTGIWEYMGQNGEGLRYLDVRTLLMYRRDEVGNYRRGDAASAKTKTTVPASQVQTLIDDIIRQQELVNPCGAAVVRSPREYPLLWNKIRRLLRLEQSLVRTMYDMYPVVSNGLAGPEIGAFEAATGRSFVPSKPGAQYSARSFLDSSLRKWVHPFYCWADESGVFTNCLRPKDHSSYYGVRRRMRLSRLFPQSVPT